LLLSCNLCSEGIETDINILVTAVDLHIGDCMVRPGGLILADNVLWDGKVCMDPLPQDKQTLGIARFNDMVSADPRVESVILPLRDGLNIIRKK
jgi:predicted O-methyltransferase YrrM